LFQAEPELNPHPVLQAPALARSLGAGLAALVLLLSACTRPEGTRGLVRVWAALTAGSLAASPVLASYHFVLLVLPVALLVGDDAVRPWLKAALAALLAFATSPYVFSLADHAHGWSNLVAAPRLLATLAILASALWLLGRPRPAWPALAGALLAALLALPGEPAPEWTRLAGTRGPAADPVDCAGTVAWVTVDGERLVVRAADGRVWQGPGDTFGPRCEGGRITVAHSVGAGQEGAPAEASDQDVAPDGTVVRADPGSATLRERQPPGERLLARGHILHPRVSPDGRWVAYQWWNRGRGWDVAALERATGRVVPVAGSRANEQQPSWTPDGRGLLFASDWNRGLGYGAVYRVGFAP
jgi:hypothetical protein